MTPLWHHDWILYDSSVYPDWSSYMFSFPRKSVLTYPNPFASRIRKNGRSSDLFQFRKPSRKFLISSGNNFRNYEQTTTALTAIALKLTAAGLSGIHTRFPINGIKPTAFTDKINILFLFYKIITLSRIFNT